MEQTIRTTLPRFVAGTILVVTLLTCSYLLGSVFIPVSLEPPLELAPAVIDFPDFSGHFDQLSSDLEVELSRLEEHIQGQQLPLQSILEQVTALRLAEEERKAEAQKMEETREVARVEAVKAEQEKSREPVTVARLIVQSNDTIWGIANRFQAPPSPKFLAEIIALNDVDPLKLRRGQILLIPLETE